MRRFVTLALAAIVARTAWRCDDSATAPQPIIPTVPPPPRIAGTWSGTESDRLGPALLTWNLTQVGPNVSGTAVMRPVDPADGSCASCHKSKVGTVEGTLSGATFTLTMLFPAGGQGDPTPACSITLNAVAPDVSPSAIAGTYSGSDPCEGVFDGTLAMTRQP